MNIIKDQIHTYKQKYQDQEQQILQLQEETNVLSSKLEERYILDQLQQKIDSNRKCKERLASHHNSEEAGPADYFQNLIQKRETGIKLEVTEKKQCQLFT